MYNEMDKDKAASQRAISNFSDRKWERSRDYIWKIILIVLTVIVLLFHALPVTALLGSNREYFPTYGVIIVLGSVLGYAATILQTYRRKFITAIIISVVTAAVIMILGAIIHSEIARSVSTTGNAIIQYIFGYGVSLIVPVTVTVIAIIKKNS